MGQDVSGEARTPAQTRSFTKALLRDLMALERMLSEGAFETGIRRIGAEQEMFLVNEAWRPASSALDKRIARFFARQLFHLLGFRQLEDAGHQLVMRRRRFDEGRYRRGLPRPRRLGQD